MPRKDDAKFPILPADLQISFYFRLGAIRKAYLSDALKSSVGQIDIPKLDQQLQQYVPSKVLQRVASFGLRGEVFFPTPILLCRNALLLGYYRLLYGISQKEFYHKGPFGKFKQFEVQGIVSEALMPLVPDLCRSLIATGCQLVEGLDTLSVEIVHDLQVLTVGPQFRGSENTRIGESAVRLVMDLIAGIVKPCIKQQTPRMILIENAAGRTVSIEFASDPDVLVTEKLEEDFRYIVSIEVKGGSDASNIHNRLGEAEKSHLKAKKLGCAELWTITRVDVRSDVAQRASPTTTKFFQLSKITNRRSKEHREFKEALAARIGIPS